jgi:hypothetical protein
VKARSACVRLLLLCVSSSVFVFLSWAFVLNVGCPMSLGLGLAQWLVPPHDSWFPTGQFWGVAFATDFVAWFAGLWGFYNLWGQFRTSLEDRDTQVWPNRIESPGILGNAMLLAFPFSCFVAGVISWLFTGGTPPSSPRFIVTFAPGFGLCVSAVYVLFSLALKFWPRPAP